MALPFRIRSAPNDDATAAPRSPEFFYLRSARLLEQSHLLQRNPPPVDGLRIQPNIQFEQRSWRSRDRRKLWWLDRGFRDPLGRIVPAIDLWREGSQQTSTTGIAFQSPLSAECAAWICHLSHLVAKRYERKQQFDWSSALYVDLLRSYSHFQHHADLSQAVVGAAAQSETLANVRHWAESPSLKSEQILRVLNELEDETLWVPARDIVSHHFQTFGAGEELSEFTELQSLSIHDRTQALRNIIAHSALTPQKRWNVEAIAYLDQLAVARSITRSYLTVCAFRNQHGYFPRLLETAHEKMGVSLPIDGYRGEAFEYQISRGQQIRHAKKKVFARQGQPLLYSSGANAMNEHCASAWDRTLNGHGDWIHPMPASRVPRSRMQIKFSHFLALFVLLSAYVGFRTVPVARQHRAIEAVTSQGAEIDYLDESEPIWPKLLGDDFGREIYSVDLRDVEEITPVLQSLSQFKSIQSLEFYRQVITAEDLKAIGQLPNLVTLDLGSCSFPGNGFHYLRNCEELVEVDFDDAIVRDYHLNAWAAVDAPADKREVKLTSLALIDSPITDQALKAIGRFTHLASLDLDSTRVTGERLSDLSELKLTSLDLRSNEISDDAVEQLRIPTLRRLYLGNTSITGRSFKHLATLPNLEHLSIPDCKLDDDDFADFPTFPCLKELCLDDIKIGEPGIRRILTNNKKLVELDLSDVRLRVDEIINLQKDYPDLYIDY